jgi:hypothetical protein
MRSPSTSIISTAHPLDAVKRWLFDQRSLRPTVETATHHWNCKGLTAVVIGGSSGVGADVADLLAVGSLS